MVSKSTLLFSPLHAGEPRLPNREEDSDQEGLMDTVPTEARHVLKQFVQPPSALKEHVYELRATFAVALSSIWP